MRDIFGTLPGAAEGTTRRTGRPALRPRAVALPRTRGGSLATRLGIALLLTLLLWAIGLALAPPAHAEGSRDLTAQGGDRAFLLWQTSRNVGGIPLRQSIKVYATPGETINLASSAHGVASGTINYRRPDGTSGTCAAPSAGNGNAGQISTLAQEQAGPAPNTGGFTPCVVTVAAGEGGVWEVDFVSPSPSADANPTALTANATWTQPNNVQYIPAWDITVRDGAGTAVPGRVYANHLSLNMGANSRAFEPDFHVQTREGYRYRLDPNGLDPFRFIFFANNKGFRNTAGEPLMRSVQLSTDNATLDALPAGTTVHDPSGADTATDFTHKLFLNTPDPNLPASAPAPGGSTWLRNVPPSEPIITNFAFTGSESTAGQAGAGKGGTFKFNANVAGLYTITLDLNSDGTFGNANDRTLKGDAALGANSRLWDGKDGNGNAVPASGNAYQARAELRAGEIHFPVLDAENNPKGTIIERVVTAPSDFTVSYDNTGLTNPTGSTPPDPVKADRVSSQTGVQKFSGSWGDHRGIDTWAYQPSRTESIEGGIAIRSADLAVTNTDNRTNLGTGDSITYVVRVTNNGPSAVAGASLTDAIPTGVENVSWTCAVTTGTGTCGAASGSGNNVQTGLDLASGAVATITVQGTVKNDAPATLTSTATVVRPNDVDDPNTANNSATDTTTINRPPAAQNDGPTTNEDTAVVVDVRANDTDPDAGQTLTVTNVGAPANGTAGIITTGPDTGRVRYTPNADYNGPDSFTYTVCDNGNPQRCSQATVNVTVLAVNDRPVLDLNGPASGTGHSGSFTEDGGPVVVGDAGALTVSDVDDTNIEGAKVTLTNRPDGAAESLGADVSGTTITAAYTASTGELVLSGSATKADYQKVLRTVRYANSSNDPSTADRTVMFTVSDGDLASEVATSTITVSAVNDAPVNAAPETVSTDEDTALVFEGTNRLSISDPDAGGAVVEVTLTVTHGKLTLPSTTGLVFSEGDGSGDATTTFRGTIAEINAAIDGLRYDPDADYNGDAVLEIRTDDLGNTPGDALSSTTSVGIGVRPVNDRPNITEVADVTIPEDGATGAIPFSVSDVETPAGDLVVSVLSDDATLLPEGSLVVVCDAGSCTVEATPAPDRFGTATITLKVTDADGATREETFVLTVEAVNDAPDAKPDEAVTDEDTPVEIDVLANDTDVEKDALSITEFTQGEHGTVSRGPDGGLLYTPNKDYNGPDSFTYTVSDGKTGDTATVTVTVRAVNDPPVARDDAYDMDEDGKLEVAPAVGVLANDLDVDSADLTVELVDAPGGGTLDLDADGGFTYTPAPDANGEITFTYRVSDGTDLSETATVTIRVAPVNDAPVAKDGEEETDEDVVLTFDPRPGVTDKEGGELTITGVTTPAHGKAEVIAEGPDAGKIRYTPDPDYNGPDSLVYTVCDDGTPRECDEATISITVHPVDDMPRAGNDRIPTRGGDDVSLDPLGNDSDPEGPLAPGSVRVVKDPANGKVAVDPQTGRITYTPNPGFAGEDTFVYTVCEAADATRCDTASVRIVVGRRYADLGLSDKAPGKVRMDQKFAYELEVENRGPNIAVNTVLTSKLPASVALVSAPRDCDYRKGNRTLTCDLGDMAVGATKRLKVQVRAVKSGKIDFNSSVQSDTWDPSFGDNAG